MCCGVEVHARRKTNKIVRIPAVIYSVAGGPVTFFMLRICSNKWIHHPRLSGAEICVHVRCLVVPKTRTALDTLAGLTVYQYQRTLALRPFLCGLLPGD